MRISDEKAIEICKNRPNLNVVSSCVSTQNEVKRHVDGTGYQALIKQVDGKETLKQAQIRKQMSKPATIPLTKVIIDELNRWTNAQGTEKAYHFDKKEKGKDFRTGVLSHVWHDKSMTDFVNTDLKESLDTEFNGFYVVTKGSRQIIGEQSYEYRDGIEVGVADNDPYIPYIIFVSIDDTLDFLKNGDKIEYLCYFYGNRVEKIGEKEKVIKQYRFLDDEWSRIIEDDGNDWTISEEEEFKPVANEIDYVPAVQISNTKKNVSVDGVMRSQLTFLVPMLDRYLEKDSELIQSETLHAFPKHWMTGIKCPECEGDKTVVNDPANKTVYTSELKDFEHMTCPVCVGEGSIVVKDPTQVAKVPQVLPEGFRPYSSEIGGYIVPPIESLEYMEKAKRALGDDIVYAGTSNKNIVSNKFKTATENNQNLKTLEDKIDDRLRNIEMVEIFLTNAIAKMHAVFSKGYKGCTIKYSRRLFYRTETEILTDIETAKRAGMSFSYIKQMQIELYRSKYVHAPIELEIAIKLTNVENFVGFTYNEIRDNELIGEESKKYKFYFNEAVEDIISDGVDILETPVKKLKELITKKIGSYDTGNQEDQD